MVKKWIIMISLIIVLIVGCVLESTYVNNSFDKLIVKLENFQVELDKNKEKVDLDSFIIEAKQIHNDWHKRVDLLKCLIWHTGIKDIEVGLARISIYIQENDYTEASAEISSLVDYLKHYSSDFDISWENIF